MQQPFPRFFQRAGGLCCIFSSEHFDERGHAGLELADIGLRVVRFDHGIGDALLFLDEPTDKARLHIVGVTGLQNNINHAVDLELVDQPLEQREIDELRQFLDDMSR